MQRRADREDGVRRCAPNHPRRLLGASAEHGASGPAAEALQHARSHEPAVPAIWEAMADVAALSATGKRGLGGSALPLRVCLLALLWGIWDGKRACEGGEEALHCCF